MRASVLYFLRLHCNFLHSLPNHRKVARRFHHWADHYLTTTVQLPCEMSEKPAVTTNNGLFVGLGAPVQNQQNLRFIVGLRRPVVVLRPGRPEVRILPVAPRAAPYGVLLFLFCMDFMEQQKSGFEQPMPRALRPARRKRPGGAFLGRGLANPFGRTRKHYCDVFFAMRSFFFDFLE